MRLRNRLKIAFLILSIIFIGIALINPAAAVEFEEGGYCGHGTTTWIPVWNFLSAFEDLEVYTMARSYHFKTDNNDYVDSVDFAYFCGDSDFMFWIRCIEVWGDTGWVNLETAGSDPADCGYGNWDLEFIVFHSCQTIPSPLETSDWWSPWVSEPDDIFDGLHQALGFRTGSMVATAPAIANYFGNKVRDNYMIWQSWHDACDAYGDPINDKAASLMHPTCEYDSYGDYVSDPPENSEWLRIWYQT